MAKSNYLEPIWDNPQKLSKEEFVSAFQNITEYCKIAKRVIAKNREEVPLNPNATQQQIIDVFDKYMNKGKVDDKMHVAALVKPRQAGGSTIVSAILQYLCTTQRNMVLVYVLQATSSVDNFVDTKLLPIIQRTHPMMMPKIRVVRKNNETQLVFEEWNNRVLNNRIIFMSANSKSEGRLLTPTAIILDEAGAYKRPEQIMDGLVAALPDNTFSLLFVLSTFRAAYDHFHNILETARTTEDQDFIFAPWYNHNEYELAEFPNNSDNKIPQMLIDSVREHLTEQDFDPETIERKVNWYANTLITKAHGDIRSMISENPTTYEELVADGNMNVFSTRICGEYLEQEVYAPYELVEEKHKVVAKEVDRSPLEIFVNPVYGHRYLISVDPNNGATGERDDVGMVVVDLDTLQECATFCTNELGEQDVAEQIYLLQRFFYGAKVLIERNVGRLLIEHCVQLGVRSIVRGGDGEYGVRTVGGSSGKSQLVKDLASLINTKMYRPRGRRSLEEFLAFIWIPTDTIWKCKGTGRFKSGELMKDDLTMARVIMVPYIRKKAVEQQYEDQGEERDFVRVGGIAW